jgi:CheY-specific phosphatase CheX
MVKEEKKRIQGILNSVVSNVMEQTAFVFPESADLDDGINIEEHNFLSTTLAFSGDRQGKVVLILPVNLCKELSANLLGEDKDSTEEQYTDAAEEVLNIITGQLLTSLYGEEAVINLTPPRSGRISGNELFSLIENKIYALSKVDDQPIIIILSLPEKVHEH